MELCPEETTGSLISLNPRVISCQSGSVSQRSTRTANAEQLYCFSCQFACHLTSQRHRILRSPSAVDRMSRHLHSLLMAALFDPTALPKETLIIRQSGSQDCASLRGISHSSVCLSFQRPTGADDTHMEDRNRT